jgi:hypothetical protein
MTIQINDGTETLCTAIYAPDVEKIVSYAAKELMDADEHVSSYLTCFGILNKDVQDSACAYNIINFIHFL